MVILILGFYGRFIYKETNYSGASAITHVPNERLVALLNGRERFVPTQADFMPNPPSDTAFILKRAVKIYETVSVHTDFKQSLK